MRKLKTSLLILLTICLSGIVTAQPSPKREFRGAWIQCVNGQFIGMSSQKLQQTLVSQLDSLQKAGINAIIFQVRPEADALYQSNYEPWSRYLTGTQGQAPNPYWDPLQFMVEQCHKREMEIHAWINPYRAKTKGTTVLATNHPAKVNPERFVSYDGLLCFDPGLPENREYICKVIADIVERYDVDGLHMDDYFYPYPVDGLEFNDDVTFATYGRGFADRGDWRRDNVNKLIQEVQQTVRSIKPWVKFGISPFGIWRNKASNPEGSNTNGLQNYDQLYADIRLWVNEGWIDYNIPQVYWQIGHTAADYAELVNWWAEHTANRPLYIGQDVMRTVQYTDLNNPNIHQQQAKMQMQRAHASIQGSCQWPASAVVDNEGGYRTALETNYHRYPALQPLYPFIDNKAPKKVQRMKVVWTMDGPVLFWTAPKTKKVMNEARQFVVYCFKKGEKINLEDPSKIVAITSQTFYNLPYQGGETKYHYIVTALDRLHNESKPVKTSVKL